MINYTNNTVIQLLRQYDMFANSLKMMTDNKSKESICIQLDKTENKILEETNKIYEEEYNNLLNRSTSLFEEEKTRITLLIEMVKDRIKYIETRNENHKNIVGHKIEVMPVLGEDLIKSFEGRLDIINKYLDNVKQYKKTVKEIEDLDNKIMLAKDKIKVNESLNIELESKMINLFDKVFTSLDLYKLVNEKEDIISGYNELKYSLDLAINNVDKASLSSSSLLSKCKEMEESVRKDYKVYNEKKNIVELIEIYKVKVSNYEQLLEKREKMNLMVQELKGSTLYKYIFNEFLKQYNTIKIEGQDLRTFESLTEEKTKKEKILREIKEENNSDKFKEILSNYIKNEAKELEKAQIEKIKLLEEEEKKKQQLEKKKYEEMLKRQKLIEENRKKEIEERTKKLLVEKEKSVLNPGKIENNTANAFSFETIKSNIEKPKDKVEKKTMDKPLETNEVKQEIKKEVKEEKTNGNSKIEEDLFKEFKNSPIINSNKVDDDDDFWTDEEENLLASLDIPTINNQKIDESKISNTIPKGNYDDYMKNFNNEKEEFFGNDSFPEFPI